MPALITAITGLAVAGGGAFTWIWARVERGFREVKVELKKCQAREAQAQLREQAEQRRSSVKLTVIELLWQEIMRLCPEQQGNHVLRRAEKLLADLRANCPTTMAIPPDMQALLDQLDEDIAA